MCLGDEMFRPENGITFINHLLINSELVKITTYSDWINWNNLLYSVISGFGKLVVQMQN